MTDARTRILTVAADLLDSGGAEALTTRGVAEAAGVQAPTLYRLFGDKSGLLAAVAQHALAGYLAGKRDRTPDADPVADLRRGWDDHVAFGLAHPGAYLVLGQQPDDVDGGEHLLARVERIARAGRLVVPVDRAVAVVRATCHGVALALIARAPDLRDLAVSDVARDAVLAAITTDEPVAAGGGAVATAVAMRAALPAVDALSVAEKALLADWLDRVADHTA